MSIFTPTDDGDDKVRQVRAMSKKARRIIHGTAKVMGTDFPPDLITALIFTIAELADTSESPAAALKIVSERFAELASLELDEPEGATS